MIASDMFPRRFPLCLLLPNLSRACAPFYHALSKSTEFTQKPSHERAREKYFQHFHRGRRRVTQKGGMQHEDFPGGHPSQYYSRPSTLNFGVLMGSGALVLV